MAVPAVPSAALLARAPRGESLTRDRYLTTQAWLQVAPPERFSAQLMTAGETDLPWIESYLQRAAESLGADQLHVYSVRLNGRPGYRVAFGTYGNAQEASDAIARMPASLRTFKPYPETVDMMRRSNAFE